MEQHSTRPPQHRPRRTSPLPPQGGPRGSVAVYRAAPGLRRPAPRLAQALRRLPNPRLTGLGSGLFCAAVMFLLGCLDQFLFDGPIAVYGVLFLLVSAVTAVWVRRADLVTAVIAVPIAFAIGILPVAGGEGGVGGQLMALFTALAMHAGWLYGGTLVAGLIVTVRKIRLMARRRQQQRQRPGAAPQGPGRQRRSGPPQPRRRTV